MWPLLVSLALAAPPPPSLCAEGETVAFSCPVSKGRTLSVCTSPDLSEGAGWLQYRFGKPGKVELAFPADTATSREKFTYARYTQPRRHDATLAFTNEGVSYKVWEHSDDESNAAGVTITLASGKPVNVDCTAPATGSLMKVEGAVPQTDF